MAEKIKLKIRLFQMNSLEKIFLGFFFYNIFNTLGDLNPELKIVTKPFVAIGVLLIIIGYWKVKKHNPFYGRLRNLFLFYLFWSTIIAFVRWLGSNQEWHQYLLTPYILQFFLPFLGLVDTRKYDWKPLVLKYAWYSLLFSVLFSFYYKTQMMQQAFNIELEGELALKNLNVSVIPMMLTIPIVSCWEEACKLRGWQRVVFYLAIVVCLLSSLISGKRTNLFVCLYFAGSIFFVYLSSRMSLLKKVFFLMALAACTYYLSTSSLSARISERIDVDNRSELIEDYKKSMSSLNWVIGKGGDGSYRTYSEYEGKMVNRGLIENAYLNLILRGGLFLLAPLLIIVFCSCLKAYKNSKVLGKSIFYELIYMASIFVLLFSLQPDVSLVYLILWLLIVKTNNDYNDIKRMKYENYSSKQQSFTLIGCCKGFGKRRI